MSSAYPYANTHDVLRGMPSEGRARASILQELEGFAHDEDKMWETGKCSGTMYCGDHEHYEFMGRAFELFAHVNALQRDMCPSMTKFEGEIIAGPVDDSHVNRERSEGDLFAPMAIFEPGTDFPAGDLGCCAGARLSAERPPAEGAGQRGDKRGSAAIAAGPRHDGDTMRDSVVRGERESFSSFESGRRRGRETAPTGRSKPIGKPG